MNSWKRAGLWLALVAPVGAQADTAADVQAMRAEIATMRSEYEARIQALEQRLKAAESTAAAPPVATAAAPPPDPAALPAPAPAGMAGASGGGGGGGFQPALSLILSGQYGRTRLDPSTYRIRGFQLPSGAAIGPGTRGFSLGETELTLEAIVDPYFLGVATITVGADDTVGVEEGYIQTTSLGNGLTLRGGRFYSGIGYLNPQHAHVWDFADAPLAYQALLGTQFNDDGVQLTWIAPTDQLVELRGELGRGRSYPGSSRNANGAGMASLSAHTGDDVGTSSSWRAGLSLLTTRATDQELLATSAAGAPLTNAFSGNTRVWIADGVWKWAPNGNATRTNFKLQGEYLRSTRDGSLVVDATGAATAGAYRAVQSGWYLQGVYQFMPRWRVGLRTERLQPGNPALGVNAGLLAADAGAARKETAMVDYNPTEFSRIRLQLAADRARSGPADWQWLVQYQMSLGAHGAHGF